MRLFIHILACTGLAMAMWQLPAGYYLAAWIFVVIINANLSID